MTAHSVSDPAACHSGKATAKSVRDGNAERRSETMTWSLDVCLRAALSRLFSREAKAVEPWVIVNGTSGGWWWWKPLVIRRPHNYPPIPFSWTILLWLLFVKDRCAVWMDGRMLSGGWTTLWVDSVSAVGPVALGVVSGLCLNKALSKSLRWGGARCVTRGPSVVTRRGRICLHGGMMSVLVEHLSPLILILNIGDDDRRCDDFLIIDFMTKK